MQAVWTGTCGLLASRFTRVLVHALGCRRQHSGVVQELEVASDADGVGWLPTRSSTWSTERAQCIKIKTV